jgi:hypothetical protein
MRGDGNVSRNFDARSVRIAAFVFARMHKSPQGPLQAGNTKNQNIFHASPKRLNIVLNKLRK